MQYNIVYMRKVGWVVLVLVAIAAIAALTFAAFNYFGSNPTFTSPFISQEDRTQRPLQKYAISQLAEQTYAAQSPISVLEILEEKAEYTTYLVAYTTSWGKITAQLNVPTAAVITRTSSLEQQTATQPAIIMLRGWAPPETYTTGTGTRNAAAEFAKAGYITIAPDFLGYGGSDAELADSWQARFIKPLQIIELIKTIESYPRLTLSENPTVGPKTVTLSAQKLGLWAHSNGGQIALTALEIFDRPLPATLWAPVTAPFPYGILFFTDELEDEGKASRLWIAQFEREYDAFDFSLSKHLDLLEGPLQIHHGTLDEAALLSWSLEFVDKIELENERRAELTATATQPTASGSATATPTPTQKHPTLTKPIASTLFQYPGADHNLQPGWAQAVARDIQFFGKQLK